MYWKQLSHFYRLEPFSFQISRNISTDRQSRDGIFTATQAFDFLFHRFFACLELNIEHQMRCLLVLMKSCCRTIRNEDAFEQRGRMVSL
jgi:hypothetical protein